MDDLTLIRHFTIKIGFKIRFTKYGYFEFLLVYEKN